ncbi:hypothetical protein GWK47_022909 [Chionoecetes opilio]|uniref:Uncharacterized protein n=1 Tax=Chionoecetes opilio TaxID=41210 RepID=A0A8J4XMJ2_CHIOP|nr:hypothetical protein GWK47_022909 [Chionoecetes opilio]
MLRRYRSQLAAEVKTIPSSYNSSYRSLWTGRSLPVVTVRGWIGCLSSSPATASKKLIGGRSQSGKVGLEEAMASAVGLKRSSTTGALRAVVLCRSIQRRQHMDPRGACTLLEQKLGRRLLSPRLPATM